MWCLNGFFHWRRFFRLVNKPCVMKKSFVTVLCLVYVSSVFFILIFGKLTGNSEIQGAFSTLYAGNIKVLEQAENILVENGVPGIVSARAQRDFFPDFLLNHEYFDLAMKWFSSESGYYLYYPGNIPVENYLAGLEGISFTQVKKTGIFIFLFAAPLVIFCIFFTPYKLRFIVSVFPGFVALYSFCNGGVFFLASALTGLVTGIHRVLYDEGFEFQQEKKFKRVFSVIWNDLFLFIIIFISPLWNFANIIPVLFTLAATGAGELFFDRLAENKRKKSENSVHFRRIKPLSTLESAQRAFPFRFRVFFFILVIAGTVFFVFFNKPVQSVFPGQAVVNVSDCNLDLEGIRTFVSTQKRDNLLYSDIPAYLNLCWEIESYPFTPVSENSWLKWSIPPDKIPETLYFTRYREDDSGRIVPNREKILDFDDSFIARCLENLPPLEKMLASYGRIAYGSENAAGTDMKVSGGKFNFYIFFVFPVFILLLSLLFLPVKFIYNGVNGFDMYL